MSKLKQVLRLYKNGDMSNRKIAETVELDKNTVNKYINQAKKDSLSLDELLALDDPVLAHRMVGGNAAYSDSRFDELKTMLSEENYSEIERHYNDLGKSEIYNRLFCEDYEE